MLVKIISVWHYFLPKTYLLLHISGINIYFWETGLTWTRCSVLGIKNISKVSRFRLTHSVQTLRSLSLTLVIDVPQGSSAGHKLCHCLRFPFIAVSTEHPGWQYNCFGDQYRDREEKAPKCCHLNWGRKLIFFLMQHPAELSWSPWLSLKSWNEFTCPVMRSG